MQQRTSNKLKDSLEKITNLSAFQNVLIQIGSIDQDKTAELETSLHNITEESHKQIKEVQYNPDKLKYLLYRESI